ncbi:MAG: hypothetical protein LQ340_001626 [Diploschistes diacapsis]|nr:MAG: hypothetical protein LQ340_001626 [Diploschistes diacapsis]
MSVRTHCIDCLRTLHRQSIACPKGVAETKQASRQPSSTSPVIRSKKEATPEAQNVPASATRRLAQEVRKAAPSFTETYVAYGVCEQLVKECAMVADYTIPQASEQGADIPQNDKGEDVGVGNSWWYQSLGMTPTFNTWAQITFLHMYLLTVRLRCFPAEHAPTWHQHLTDHFFHLAEDRMVTMHRINSRMIRNKYLKDLFVQWRGLTFAYDEGLMKGDAVLAAAVWRNICKGDENVDLRRLAEIVSYMRSVLAGFDTMTDEVIAGGDIVFGDPSSEEAIVKGRSRLMDPAGDSKIQKKPAKALSSSATEKKS